MKPNRVACAAVLRELDEVLNVLSEFDAKAKVPVGAFAIVVRTKGVA